MPADFLTPCVKVLLDSVRWKHREMGKRCSWTRVANARQLGKKMSQAELGKVSGISGDIIGKYERDEMKPSIDTARKLADGLSVSLDYLVGDGELKIVDKDMLRRLEAINHMPQELKNHVLHFIDMSIRDFKAKQAYS